MSDGAQSPQFKDLHSRTKLHQVIATYAGADESSTGGLSSHVCLDLSVEPGEPMGSNCVSKGQLAENQHEIPSTQYIPPPDLTTYLSKIGDQYFAGGSFADVYKCWYQDGPTRTQAAVKAFRFKFTISGDAGDRGDKMLRRELGIWKRLEHDNIVPFLGIAYGFGMSGSLSLVSLWMPNGSLHNFLATHDSALEVVHRLQFLLDIANGMLYLHSLSIVHGDLNCNNVLVDACYNVRLVDFGYASLVGNVPEALNYLHRSTTRPGALRWAPPEHINPATESIHTAESDIYSFGCVVLQVLSGKVPWSEVQGDMAITFNLARGLKPGRPASRSMDDSHWEFIQDCWSRPGERPAMAEIISLIYRFIGRCPQSQSLCDLLSSISSHTIAETIADERNHRREPTLGDSTGTPFSSSAALRLVDTASPKSERQLSLSETAIPNLERFISAVNHSLYTPPDLVLQKSSTQPAAQPAPTSSGSEVATNDLFFLSISRPSQDDPDPHDDWDISVPTRTLISSKQQSQLPLTHQSNTLSPLGRSISPTQSHSSMSSNDENTAQSFTLHHYSPYPPFASGSRPRPSDGFSRATFRPRTSIYPGTHRDTAGPSTAKPAAHAIEYDGLRIDEQQLLISLSDSDEVITLHRCCWRADHAPCDVWVRCDKSYIFRHIQRWHMGKRGGDKTLVQCRWSGCEKTMRKESIARHIVSVHLDEMWRCQGCGKQMGGKGAYGQHAVRSDVEACRTLSATITYAVDTKVINARSALNSGGRVR